MASERAVSLATAPEAGVAAPRGFFARERSGRGRLGTPVPAENARFAGPRFSAAARGARAGAFFVRGLPGGVFSTSSCELLKRGLGLEPSPPRFLLVANAPQ